MHLEDERKVLSDILKAEVERAAKHKTYQGKIYELIRIAAKVPPELLEVHTTVCATEACGVNEIYGTKPGVSQPANIGCQHARDEEEEEKHVTPIDDHPTLFWGRHLFFGEGAHCTFDLHCKQEPARIIVSDHGNDAEKNQIVCQSHFGNILAFQSVLPEDAALPRCTYCKKPDRELTDPAKFENFLALCPYHLHKAVLTHLAKL
jgi:hypothetical protein